MREGVKRQEGNLCPPSVRWRAKQGTSHRPRQRPIAGQKRSKPTSGKGTLPSITFGGGRGNRVRSFGRLRHTAPRVIQQHTHNTPEWQNAAMPPHCTLLSLSLSLSLFTSRRARRATHRMIVARRALLVVFDGGKPISRRTVESSLSYSYRRAYSPTSSGWATTSASFVRREAGPPEPSSAGTACTGIQRGTRPVPR